MDYERPAVPRGTRAPGTPSREGNPAREGGAQSNTRSTPTTKMLEFARSVSEQLGLEMPAEVETSFDACREFLDAHPLPPSDKQINLAERVSQENGVAVPAEARKDRRAMSKWLDEQMAKRK